MTLVFTYDPLNLPAGVEEARLTIARYDPVNDNWIQLASTVDTIAHTVTATTDHFSTFQVMATPVPAVVAPHRHCLSEPQRAEKLCMTAA